MSFSFAPSTAVESGFPEGDYRVIESYVKVHDWRKKDGSIPPNSRPAVCAFLHLESLTDKEHKMESPIVLNIGSPESYSISDDQGRPVPTGEKGTRLDGAPMTKSSDIFFFLVECMSCGLTEQIMAEKAGNNIAALFTGMEAHFVGKAKPKKEGTVTSDKDKKNAFLTPVPTKVMRWPWEAAGAGASRPSTTTANTAAKPNGAPASAANGAANGAAAGAVSGDVKKTAAALLTEVLEADTDGDIKDSLSLKKAITKVSMKKKMAAAERNAVIEALADVDFFNESGSAIAVGDAFYNYTLDGDTISRVAAE